MGPKAGSTPVAISPQPSSRVSMPGAGANTASTSALRPSASRRGPISSSCRANEGRESGAISVMMIVAVVSRPDQPDPPGRAFRLADRSKDSHHAGHERDQTTAGGGPRPLAQYPQAPRRG